VALDEERDGDHRSVPNFSANVVACMFGRAVISLALSQLSLISEYFLRRRGLMPGG
jgi:hypothetical protein